MKNKAGALLELHTPEYRALPLPHSPVAGGQRQKRATFYVHVADLPRELTEWMGVNPRIPRYDRKERLKGPVVAGIRQTLSEDPELFEIINSGIWILADKLNFVKTEGGAGIVEVVLTDPERHGLVNGGHTAKTIFEWVDDHPGERPDAYVVIHAYEGIDEHAVPALAEGLNRSVQVDDPSLANLGGYFTSIEDVMYGKRGADEIAYHQGATGEIDISTVLMYASLFDLSRFNWEVHPNGLFGHPKAVLEFFVTDHDLDKKDKSKTPDKVFPRILPRLPEILVLADRIQQLAWEKHSGILGRLKVSNAQTANRAGSAKHKSRDATFVEGTIDGAFPQGWLLPTLAAFRANVDPTAWKAGKLEWLMDNEALLQLVIKEFAETISREHQDNKRRPAEVGRRDAAYRLCYAAVAMKLLAAGKLGATAA